MKEKKCCVCKSFKSFSLFYQDKTKKDGLQPKCKDCGIRIAKEHYRRNKHLLRDRMKTTNDEQKAKCKEFLKRIKESLGCAICRNEFNSVVLDCHHVKNKTNDIATILGMKSPKKLIEELKKCIILCANCHRKLHAKIVELPNNITTITIDNKTVEEFCKRNKRSCFSKGIYL